MQNVLADLVLGRKPPPLMAIRLAESFDMSAATTGSGHLAASRRPFPSIGCASGFHPFVARRWNVLGAMVTWKIQVMPRLYREAPLYGIWEGSGNVICLDILRALKKEPVTGEALLQELHSAKGADKRFDLFTNAIENDPG